MALRCLSKSRLGAGGRVAAATQRSLRGHCPSQGSNFYAGCPQAVFVGTILVSELVPNPLYRDLQKLLADVKARQHSLGSLLDTSVSRMQCDDVWIGPAARQWRDGALAPNKMRLRRLAQALVDDVEAKLKATPDMVKPDVAQNYSRSQRLR